jgi:hypothetical protein
MPSRKTTKAAASASLPEIPKELIDQFVTGPMTPEAVQAASMAFKKALIARALGAELSHHLGYQPGATRPEDSGNHRNGVSGKTALTEDGPVRIEVPRDRDGSFEPLLIPKHERRFTGFDDKIVAMYARGMTVREIQGFLAEQYGTEVSPEFISSVTDAVMAEVTAWQSRPLESMYPVVFFDALRVKIREDAVVRNKAVYLALGVLPDGTRDILGLWIEQTGLAAASLCGYAPKLRIRPFAVAHNTRHSSSLNTSVQGCAARSASLSSTASRSCSKRTATNASTVAIRSRFPAVCMRSCSTFVPLFHALWNSSIRHLSA